MRAFIYLLHLPHHKTNYLSLLFIASTLRTFAWSLLALFVPILIIKLIQAEGGSYEYALVVVGLAYLALHAVAMVAAFLSSYLTSRFGLKGAFITAQILLWIFFMLMPLCTTLHTLLLNFFLLGVAAVIWWQTYNTYFSEVGNSKEYGSEAGTAEFLGIFTGVIGPVIGGLVIHFYGSTILYYMAALVVVCSIIAIAYIQDMERFAMVTPGEILKECFTRKRDFIAYIGIGGEELLYTLVWPVLLYSILKDSLNLGIFSSAVVLIAAIVAYISGKLSDKHDKAKLEKFGSIIVVFSWLGKALSASPILLFLYDSVHRVFQNFIFIPVMAVSLIHASQDNRLRYMSFREIAIRIGSILALLIFLGMVMLGLPVWSVFIAGSVFALMPLVVREK